MHRIKSKLLTLTLNPSPQDTGYLSHLALSLSPSCFQLHIPVSGIKDQSGKHLNLFVPQDICTCLHYSTRRAPQAPSVVWVQISVWPSMTSPCLFPSHYPAFIHHSPSCYPLDSRNPLICLLLGSPSFLVRT